MVSSTVAPSAIVSEHLNVDNYEYWSRCVKTYLSAEDLWEVVDPSGDPPKDDHDPCHRQNAKALHVILISCGSGIFPVISDAKSARVAWDLLARKFGSVHYSNQSDLTPVDGGRRVQHEETSKQQATNGHENGGVNNVALEKAFGALSDLNKIMEFIRQHPEAVRMRRPTENGWTALHMAVLKKDRVAVEQLVQLMEEEDLEIKDNYGRTAFFYSLERPTNLNIIKCLIRKNNALAYTCFDYFRYKNVIPVIVAVSDSNWEVAECLYRHTPKDALKPENGPNGADIITGSILRRKNFRINIEDDHTSFGAFLDVETPGYDEENQIWEQNESEILALESPLSLWQRICSHCAAVGNFVEEPLMAVLKLLGIFDRVYQKKFFHVQVHRLLQCMAKVSNDNIEQKSNSVVQTAIFRAIQCGFVDVLVTQNQYTDAMEIRDKRGRNALTFAVECRQEKIYNLIRENFVYLNGRDETLDNIGNSLLHIVGSLSPSIQLNHIRDAALQMQRELQWFKEMKSFVSPSVRELVNYEDNMTARELFTKNHKKLKKEGEKSMKETATSCSIAGALIVTIMFASAFTVVGGNDGKTGLPVLSDDILFIVFIVSDALSLFSSTTSVMIFLGILTSRYQENDFLLSLPTKTMVGLLFLLFSIATMMVAFSTTLIIMLHDQYSWIVAPIIVLACLPITTFVWMQYPLLAEIYVSTYGPGIFGKSHVAIPVGKQS